jgi:ArsR family metal-binding transcriptional regulator
MKKLLSLLGAIGLVATSSATVVSCDNGDSDATTYELGDITVDTVKDADKDMAVISNILKAVQTAAEANKDYARCICSSSERSSQLILKKWHLQWN